MSVRAAARAQCRGEDGPLLGIPIALKDDLEVAERVASRGSAAFTRAAVADAPPAAAIRAAGMVPIGTTTLPELVGPLGGDATLMVLAAQVDRG